MGIHQKQTEKSAEGAHGGNHTPETCSRRQRQLLRPISYIIIVYMRAPAHTFTSILKTDLLSVSLNRIRRPLYHINQSATQISHGANRMHLSNS